MGAQGLLHMEFCPVPSFLKLPLDKEPFGHCIHQTSPEEGSFQLPLSSFPKTQHSAKVSRQ